MPDLIETFVDPPIDVLTTVPVVTIGSIAFVLVWHQ
ncbi:hypothetical protein ABIE00_005099 [Arthrobacter sp. OAP107]